MGAKGKMKVVKNVNIEGRVNHSSSIVVIHEEMKSSEKKVHDHSWNFVHIFKYLNLQY